MTRPRHSIDGFSSRRSSLDGFTRRDAGLPPVRPIATRDRHVGEPARPITTSHQHARPLHTEVNPHEISESLKTIDSPEPGGRKRKSRISWKKVRRILKWLAIFILIVGISIGTYLAVKALMAGGNVFKGNPFDIIQTKPLKMDENGRSNILILGTSEDDPGHEAATLTDSMMILSVDQNKKNVYMISIPRDLYVKFGQACPGGYQSKINEYFGCIGGDPTNVQLTRDALTKEGEFIGQIFGLDIQYGANLNYTVMRDLVKAVGGSIQITIESSDPRGQMDSNFDWKCGAGKLPRAEQIKRCPPRGHFIDYPNGPVTLDAEHTLYLAQARGNGALTYGFPASNFDREKNQQKIIKALREKAVSAGVVTDFGKVAGIIDALGNNLRTTFETSEIRTLVSLVQDIKSENIRSINLNDPEEPMMMNGNANGMSIVRPAAGLYEYGELQAYIKRELLASPATREKAKITVLNGSGVAGAASVEADKLKAQGLIVDGTDNAPAGDYGKVTIYQIDKTKTATATKLKEIYGVKVLTTAPPVPVTGDTAFVVIVGTIAKQATPSAEAQ